MALSTDQKLDSLLAGFAEVKQKLGKLEADLAETKESHEESTERALKRIKRDRPLQFQKKGHEEQFKFNLDVQDHVSAAASHLGKLAPSEKDKPIVEKAIKELEEGASTLAERQKHIRLADQSENGWAAVAEYIGHSFADDEADDKKMENSDKSAGIKKRRRAAAAARKAKKPYGQPQPGYHKDYYDMGYRREYYDDRGYQGPQGYYRQDQFYRPKPERPPYRKPRGPCYQCGKMGHIRAECTSQSDKYPFRCEGVSGGGKCNVHVCASDYPFGLADTVSTESKGQSEVIYHSEEVLDTTSEHDSNVNGSLCKGGVKGTGKYNHLIAATNYPCAGVNTACVKGQGKMVHNTTSEQESAGTVSLCKEGVMCPEKYKDPISASNYSFGRVNNLGPKSKGRSKVNQLERVFNTAFEYDFDGNDHMVVSSYGETLPDNSLILLQIL